MISTASTGSPASCTSSRAEPGAEAHVRHELVGVVAGRRGHVDGAAQQPAAQDGGDLLGHGHAGAAARVGGRRASAALVSSRCGAASTAADSAAPGSTATAAPATGPRGQRRRERVEVHGARRAGTDHAGARPELRQLGGAEERRASGGVCTTSTSACASTCSGAMHSTAPTAAAPACGSQASTVMPSARARSTSSAELGRTPTSPSVLPRTSTPSPGRRAASPRRSAASAPDRSRAHASTSASACSASETSPASGAWTTTMPRRVAAATSMPLTSTPAADHLERAARRQDGGRRPAYRAGDEGVAAVTTAQQLRLVPSAAGLDGQSFAEEDPAPRGRGRRGRSLSSSRSCHDLSRRVPASRDRANEDGVVREARTAVAASRPHGTRRARLDHRACHDVYQARPASRRSPSTGGAVLLQAARRRTAHGGRNGTSCPPQQGVNAMGFKDASIMPVLAVDDIDRAMAFYRDKLGFNVQRRRRPAGGQRSRRDRLERLSVPLQDRRSGAARTPSPRSSSTTWRAPSASFAAAASRSRSTTCPDSRRRTASPTYGDGA